MILSIFRIFLSHQKISLCPVPNTLQHIFLLASHLFFLGGKILIVCLFSILQSQAECWQPSICFAWGGFECLSLSTFSQSCRFRLAFYTCSKVSAKACTCCTQRYLSEVCRALGVPTGQLGDLWVWHPQWLVSNFLDGVCVLSIPSESHDCPPATCHEAHFGVLDG